MFTINQIKEAHAKVKTGADYPDYVQEIIKLGVTGYTTFLHDSHSEYYGQNNYSTSSPAGNIIRGIALTADIEKFKYYLKIHQQGETDFLTFCNDAVATGVEKWKVDFSAMTCAYYDMAGNIMLVEKIGQVS